MLRTAPTPQGPHHRKHLSHSLQAIVFFFANPRAYVGWTILQFDPGQLAIREELHCIPIDQNYVAQVEHDAWIALFLAQNTLQLCQILDLHPSGQSKNH